MGDIILLYQTINGEKFPRFTHLVEILSTEIQADEFPSYYKYGFEVQVVGRIMEGVEKRMTSLADVLSFKPIAQNGRLQQLNRAIKQNCTLSIADVQSRICDVFNYFGEIK